MTSKTPTPAYIPSAVTIFKNLAAGDFRPMARIERAGRDGAGPDAQVMIIPSSVGDLFIVADWQAGEGLHIEITEGDGTTWGINPQTGEIDQLCEGWGMNEGENA